MTGTPNSTFDLSVPLLVLYYTATRTHCQFAAHRVFGVLDGVYRVLQILSPFLLGQQMDDGLYRLVLDLNGVQVRSAYRAATQWYGLAIHRISI